MTLNNNDFAEFKGRIEAEQKNTKELFEKLSAQQKVDAEECRKCYKSLEDKLERYAEKWLGSFNEFQLKYVEQVGKNNTRYASFWVLANIGAIVVMVAINKTTVLEFLK